MAKKLNETEREQILRLAIGVFAAAAISWHIIQPVEIFSR